MKIHIQQVYKLEKLYLQILPSFSSFNVRRYIWSRNTFISGKKSVYKMENIEASSSSAHERSKNFLRMKIES